MPEFSRKALIRLVASLDEEDARSLFEEIAPSAEEVAERRRMDAEEAAEAKQTLQNRIFGTKKHRDATRGQPKPALAAYVPPPDGYVPPPDG